MSRPVLAAFDSVWTYGALAQVVNRIDSKTNKVEEIKIDTIGTSNTGIADFDGSMWFAGKEGNVFRIDPTTNKVIATIPVVRRTCPGSLAGGDGSLWWACEGSVARIDPATDAVVDTFKVEGWSRRLRSATGTCGSLSDNKVRSLGWIRPPESSPTK